MSTPTAAASIYTDFSAFGGLRRDARANSPEALRAVAQQFEAMFLNMIFKGMRDGKLADDVLGGDGEELYQELHDQQLALHLSQTNSLGIADMMVRQLEKSLPPDEGARASGEAPSNAAPKTPTGAYTLERREPRLDLRI
jgi:flagellar protein FlgJ